MCLWLNGKRVKISISWYSFERARCSAQLEKRKIFDEHIDWYFSSWYSLSISHCKYLKNWYKTSLACSFQVILACSGCAGFIDFIEGLVLPRGKIAPNWATRWIDTTSREGDLLWMRVKLYSEILGATLDSILYSLSAGLLQVYRTVDLHTSRSF